jgi:uroporphyrin-III C-methyltransferase
VQFLEFRYRSCLSRVSLTKEVFLKSFWVVQDTTSDRKLSNDVALAAQSSATVVILMGNEQTTQIIDLFQKNLKANSVIQNGTTAQEKIGVGTINTIQQVVAEQIKFTIIVIGEW